MGQASGNETNENEGMHAHAPLAPPWPLRGAFRPGGRAGLVSGTTRRPPCPRRSFIYLALNTIGGGYGTKAPGPQRREKKKEYTIM